MVKVYELYMFRRIAFGLSQEDVAERAGINLEVVQKFESGVAIDRQVFKKIKNVIWKATTDCSKKKHYQARILEIAMRINTDDSDDMSTLQEISHLFIELGKLQGALMGFESGRGYK